MQNKKYKFLAIIASMMIGIPCNGQEYKFKKLNFTHIKDAPILSAPEFIKDKTGKAIQIGKLGYAYPSIFDSNHDGKPDLIVGDFMLGERSNLNVYLNIGTAKKPLYSPTPEQLKDVEGTPLHIKGL